MIIWPANHWLYQLGMCCLLISYATVDLLPLRIVLAIGSLLLALWGLLILDVSVDTTVWNLLFFVINSIQAILLLWKKRPIKFVHVAHESIYQEVFSKVGISRLDFKSMVKVGFLRSLKAGSYYIEAGNVVNNLSLLYQGKLELYRKRSDRVQTVNLCEKWEFVEAPEWAARFNRRVRKGTGPKPATPHAPGVSDDECVLLEWQDAETINVSAKAAENCLFLTWPVEELEVFLIKHPHIVAPFNALVGADVAKKLFRAESILPPKALQLTEEEQLVRQVFLAQTPNFDHMDPVDLLSTGKLTSIRRVGTIYLRAGEEMTTLGLLQTGEMEAVLGEGVNEKVIYVVRPPQFLGALEFTSQDHIALFTLRTRVPCTIFQWDARDLQRLCVSNSNVHHVLTAAFAADLSVKLIHSLLGETSSVAVPTPLLIEEQKGDT